MPIRYGVRGIGGEIGDLTTRVPMALRRERFEGFLRAIGGSMNAFIRLKPGQSIQDTIRGDRSFKKLQGPSAGGSLRENTASSYHYAGDVVAVEIDPTQPNRVKVYGRDGRVLPIDCHAIPETNRGVAELSSLDFLIDATGVGLKDIKKTPDQDPNLYASEYPGLTVLFSAPCKTVKGIAHFLNGLRLASAGQLNATGSCSTHAGVDVIRTVREGLIEKFGLAQDDLFIEGGLFDATHSLTPTDNGALAAYAGATVKQTTGFGGAAAKVYPVGGIKNMQATTRRYDSYHPLADGNWANGISTYSLTMQVTIRRNGQELTPEVIAETLTAAAKDAEGRNHIGIISSAFDADKNKKDWIMTTLSLSGMVPTAMLPLGNNINVVKGRGTTLIDGVEYDSYTITIGDVAYDNRLGFTTDMLCEANQIAFQRGLGEIIPGFDPMADLGDHLAFVNSPSGRELFANALAKTDGSLLQRF